jgi:hypothetical protein
MSSTFVIEFCDDGRLKSPDLSPEILDGINQLWREKQIVDAAVLLADHTGWNEREMIRVFARAAEERGWYREADLMALYETSLRTSGAVEANAKNAELRERVDNVLKSEAAKGTYATGCVMAVVGETGCSIRYAWERWAQFKKTF